MANRLPDPLPQWIDDAGNPYVGASLYFYITGTTTPTDSYSDSTLSTLNTNPVVLDSAGRLPDDVFLDPAITYSLVLKDADGVTVWTADPVVDPAANVSAAFRIVNANPNGTLAGSAGAIGGSAASAVFDIANGLLWVCTTTGTATTAVWTQVGANLSGAVRMTGVISPSSFAVDKNDYSPASLPTASIMRLTVSADVTITGLTGGASGRILIIENIATANKIVLSDENSASTAANRFGLDGDITLKPEQSVMLWYDATSARWRQVGNAQMTMNGEPGGRLCLATGEPVAASDLTAMNIVFYTPYRHNMVRLYNGSNWYTVQFSELSQILSDSTKSPSAAAVSSVYDMFLWQDTGTLRCTRGPAWSTATSRGTGAGTTELVRQDGIYLNAVAITNGPAAKRGVYVGTIATNATGANGEMAVMLYPAAAAGGSNNRVDVWNYYNRVPISSTARDSTDSWAYTTATWRAANNNNANRITFVAGINEEQADVVFSGCASNSTTGAAFYAGIGYDSTSAFSGSTGGEAPNSNSPVAVTAVYRGMTGLGLHYFQALEYSVASGTTNWYGDNGASVVQMSLVASWRY